MVKKPELVKLSETEYGCSLGDWKAEAVKPSKMSYSRWAQRRQCQFEEHVKQSHSHEGYVNQA
jgi:hypothetical protein